MSIYKGIRGEKYGNGRAVVRRGGKFARTPSLQELGLDINVKHELKTCQHCGNQQIPLMNTGWICCECEKEN